MRHIQRAIVSVTIVGTAATGLATTAVAQTAVGASQVRACYVPGSGTIYRVKTAKAPRACVGADHVEFTLGGAPIAPGAAAGQGNAPIDHGSLAGLLDDDHPQYLPANGTRSTVNGFAVTGFGAGGSTPASGLGTRLMWYPRKAAFRAGRLTDPIWSTSWDDANIGDGSIGMGINTQASGLVSIAMGSESRALGIGSIAIGPGTSSSGKVSVAMGSNAVASGAYALSAGKHSFATGESSVAVGPSAVASGERSIALGSDAAAPHAGAVVISAYMPSIFTPLAAVAPAQFVARANRFWFGNNNSVTALPGQLIATSTGAHLTTGGTWVNSSDSTTKTAFEAVDGESVLAKLAQMPIRTWSYRAEDSTVRHIGPTAQDFRAAYGLGDTETAIATVDADGIALAAVQTLERRTRDYARMTADLRDARRQIQELWATIDALRTRVEQLRTTGLNR